MNTELLISQYIDDELNLDEKITFVEIVHDDPVFTKEALDFLKMEKQLSQLPAYELPPLPKIERVPSPEKSWYAQTWWKPFIGFAAAGVIAAILLTTPQPKPVISSEPHRFVVYLPDVEQAQVIGTFTDWQPVAMTPIGTSGYWTLTLKIPMGEHRYSYLVGQDQQIPDPTVALREQDDFGGENSVLEIGGTAI